MSRQGARFAGAGFVPAIHLKQALRAATPRVPGRS